MLNVCAQEAFLPKYNTFARPILAFLLSIQKPFLVEIDLSGGPKDKNEKINKTFWGLLGSRHVQTSLEIMWFILFLLFGFRWFFGFFVLFVLSFGV